MTPKEINIIGRAHRRYKEPMPFGLTVLDRLHHMYLIGQTGTGKSTLLFNMALQDAKQSTGLCLLDPHGDLAEQLHRSLDQPHIYWNVANPKCPYGYNPLRRVAEAYRPLVASGLIETLKKQWPDAWGARMEHLLRQAILTLLELPESDLRDIMKLFVYSGFRRRIIDELSDPQLRFFWKEEYARMNYQSSADGVSPIANKVSAFLTHPKVRKSLCEPEKQLRFRQIMDKGQILIVNLAKGRLGGDITNVLGGMISGSFMYAALSRHNQSENLRNPFFLYVDEFPNLTTKSFAGLLSEARKYALGLVLAHQHLSQTDDEVRDAILGNVGSSVVFRLGAKDAPFFERFLEPFSTVDFQNQPNHQAVVQLMHGGARLKPFTANTFPAFARSANSSS